MTVHSTTKKPSPLSLPQYHLQSGESDSDPDQLDQFSTPLLEEGDPLLPASQLSSDMARVTSTHKARRRSSSDLMLAARRYREATDDSSQTAFLISNSTPGPGTYKPLSLDHRLPMRSHSALETEEPVSRYHDPAIDSATLQQQLVEQTKHVGLAPARPWRVRSARATSTPFQWTNPQSPEPGFMWFPVRTKSDPSTSSKALPRPKIPGKDLPLKPIMKKKSKSATATPPDEFNASSVDSSKSQKLRRVKTVDFEESSKKLLKLPPLKAWSSETDPNPSAGNVSAPERRSSRGGSKQEKPADKSKPSPPFYRRPVKSTPADPAITRTDVHVVAIAPSWCAEDDIPDEGGIDPATPTMQIVESKSGCYEVIWDDVPSEYDVRSRRRSSSAGQVLQSVGSTAARGLDRVNSKLTEWSWGRGTSSSSSPSSPSFNPQIVVFPGDDSRAPQYDCTIDDEDLIIIAPPNSEMTSATPSSRPSRPASAPTSRSASYEEPQLDSTMGDGWVGNDKRDSIQEPLMFPNPEAGTARKLLTPNRGTKRPPSFRRLSNIEENEMKFRGHGDSVALAHSRVINAGGVSPGLFKHRDSVALVRKRMHARNHAISNAIKIPHSRDSSSEPLNDMNETRPLPSPSAVKSKAAKALKNSDPASMLLPQVSSSRHIRIVE
ncbi:hypothetical protein BS50DRAFT_574111 [Corynespora cassiicola Philippines]|uniref:Uncharacterized protein n=1 Tax=Corynespora cassiicola Philippines TaxID=1448308 RepID=A0A2T2NPN9_CORCC|nr:hypothetical protein BS50DRAFT_574111 [Corynespora cassiicola Philippines]